MNTNERSLTYKKIMPLILVYAVMVGLSIVANFLNPGFLSLSHIWTIVRQMSFLGIVCIGQTLVILTGGIDLSMQYTLVLCNVVSAQVISGQNENTWGAGSQHSDLGSDWTNQRLRRLLFEDTGDDYDLGHWKRGLGNRLYLL